MSDVIVEVIACAHDGLPVLVRHVGFLESHIPPSAILARENHRDPDGSTPINSHLLFVVRPVSREIQNCNSVGKHHTRIFGLLRRLGMDVAFRSPDRCQTLALSLARPVVVGTDGIIVDKLVECSQIASVKSSPNLVLHLSHRLLCSRACNRRLILLGGHVKRRQQDECDEE